MALEMKRRLGHLETWVISMIPLPKMLFFNGFQRFWLRFAASEPGFRSAKVLDAHLGHQFGADEVENGQVDLPHHVILTLFETRR